MKIEQRIPTKVRGTTFRAVAFGLIQTGDRLDLFREYDNPYDLNAVRIVHDGSFIGYVGRDLAASLATAMDAGRSVHGLVDEITGGTPNSPNQGLNITIIVSQEIPDHAFAGALG